MSPCLIVEQFEQACQLVATERVGLINKNKDAPITVPDFQVILQSTSRAISIRSLTVLDLIVMTFPACLYLVHSPFFSSSYIKGRPHRSVGANQRHHYQHIAHQRQGD